MFVHRSNRLEELVDHLHQVVSEPTLGLLEPETIIIQSAGMERYLSRELSRRSGVLANVDFPFPRSFFHQVLDAALGEDERAKAFDRESLGWVIYSNLAKQLSSDDAAFDGVRRYLEGDEDRSKQLLLAERLAHLFDQYVTYRPRMVLAWEQGADQDDFQAILWRQLVEQLGSAHFAARCNRFMNEVVDEELRKALPARLSLMGGPGLPPLFLQMFARIGQLIPCHVFSFSVCEEYFADAHPLNDPLPDVGEGLHPLLISLGKVGADYQHLLEMIGGYEEGGAQFHPEQPVSVLGTLQQSLIEGRREPKGMEQRRVKLLRDLSNDRSITVDSCHSALREIETLHDRLLAWFDADPTLRPEDVVVLAPNIEEYSPLISAVFSARAGDKPQIPFRIADRSEKFTNAAARALLLSFSVLRGRVKASEVLDLLQLAPVRARYGIESTDLERIARWVSDSGIRWGVDAEHRAEFGLPEDDANTWRFGLRRLLLGYAMPDDGVQLWQDVVPLDEVAVSDLELVGKLCDFCENLFSLRKRLQQAGQPGLSLSGWELFLTDLMNAVLSDASESDDEDTWDTGTIRLAVFEMAETAQLSLALVDAGREEQRLSARSMAHLLEERLDSSRPSTDFLSGGVTFCALLPLRTIPFRAVCVLGLNQGEFPRSDSHHQLDLMDRSPKRGDRSLRADDRYLFLEVILAARERLSLSYVGRSVQDNTEKPPSVVVSELSAVMDQMLQLPEDAAPYLRPTEHPLQPFHPDYFRRPGNRTLRSFDQGAYLGATALAQEPQNVAPFFDAEAQAEMDAYGGEFELTIEQLVSFWKRPSAAFFAARGVSIRDEIEDIENREPVIETPLARFIVGDRLLEQRFRGESLRADIELSRGQLPVGAGGQVLLDAVGRVANEIFSASTSYRDGKAREPLRVTQVWRRLGLDETLVGMSVAPIPQVALTGVVRGVYGDIRLETSYGLLNTNRKIGLWIRHLAACAMDVGVTKSVLVVRGNPRSSQGVEVFALGAVEVDKARDLLGQLCALALIGHQVPLRFFPGASERYFEAVTKPLKKLEADEIVPWAFEEARRHLFPVKAGLKPDEIVTELYRGEDPLGCLDSSKKLTVHPSDLSELPFARLAATMFHPMWSATLEEQA